MKKTLLTMCALLIAVAAVNAQKMSALGEVKGLNPSAKPVPMKSNKLESPVFKVDKPVAKINVGQGERLVGYYTTDDFDYAYPFQYYAGDYKIGTPFYTEDVLNKAVGGQITKARVGLYESMGSTTVSLYEITTSGISSSPVASATLATTQKGWNDVTFNTPYTIKEDCSYLLAYDFSIATNGGSHNFLIDDGLNTEYLPGGVYMYGNLGQGIGWYRLSSSFNICAQMVVKGGKYSDDDIVLTGGIDRTIAKRGENIDVTMTLKNEGNNVPNSYALNVLLDGESVGTINTPVDLSDGSRHSYTYSLSLPESLSKDEEHNVSVSVANINGNAPTANTDDDKFSASFNVYGAEDVVTKQKTLLEQFTASGCVNCPYGYDFLNALNAKRNDLVWVAAHTDFSEDFPDEYTTNYGSNLFVLQTGFFPTASFNRAYISDPTLNGYGYVALPIGINTNYIDMYTNLYSNMIDAINTDIPAFASVNIASEYNADTRELKVTVSGEGNADVQKVLADGAVSVFLTEDGLKGDQASGYTETGETEITADYPHDHVLRMALDGEYGFGEPIKWTSGTAYSNTYTVTLDEGWNADNMNIVAFVGRAINVEQTWQGATIMNGANDIWVSNTETVKLGETSTGIENAVTVTDEDTTEVARYALDGTQLSVPTKGVNIVKMSDGTTKKVIVK